MIRRKDRRTGKTFRALMRALLRASQGHNVYYITDTHSIALWCSDRAKDLVKAYTGGTGITCTQAFIKFNGSGGSVRFIGKESGGRVQDLPLRGVSRQDMVWDLNWL